MGGYTREYVDKNAGALDRKRERERHYMLQSLHKNAEALSTKLVQRLIDKHIIETTAPADLRQIFKDLFEKMAEMEEFDIQFKTAPLRQLVVDPNFVSLYLTQYVIEDLIEHSKVQDVFGDDLEIYRVIESVMSAIRPQH